jgi:phosphoribosylformylglycinamidine synthase
MTARDQMVGPWQVPVADVAVTTMGYQVISAKPSPWASARRWRPRCAGLRPHGDRRGADQPRGGRYRELADVKLSANWMAPAGVPGEDARLFDTVRAVSDLCKQIGVSIPVGKDSLSMRTAWEDAGEKKQVVSPLSLIVTARLPRSTMRAQDQNAATQTRRRRNRTAAARPRQEPPRRLRRWHRCSTRPEAMRRMSMIRPS